MGSQVASRRVGEQPRLTRFHQRIAAEALTARGGGGTSRLAPGAGPRGRRPEPAPDRGRRLRARRAAHRRRRARRRGRAGQDHRGRHRPGPARRRGEGPRHRAGPRLAPGPVARRAAHQVRPRGRACWTATWSATASGRGCAPTPSTPAGSSSPRTPSRAMRAAEVERVPLGRGGHRRGAPAPQRLPQGPPHRPGAAPGAAPGAQAAPHRHPAAERPDGAAGPGRLHRRRAARRPRSPSGSSTPPGS